GMADPADYEDPLVKDTLEVISTVRTIQEANGENGCCRYIISQCSSVVNVLEVMGLFLLSGWTKKDLAIDIVPLFETVDDLRAAAGVMKALYEHKDYSHHLKQRGKTQTIMLGFSDGT